MTRSYTVEIYRSQQIIYEDIIMKKLSVFLIVLVLTLQVVYAKGGGGHGSSSGGHSSISSGKSIPSNSSHATGVEGSHSSTTPKQIPKATTYSWWVFGHSTAKCDPKLKDCSK
jgi:hypothetical protein